MTQKSYNVIMNYPNKYLARGTNVDKDNEL